MKKINTVVIATACFTLLTLLAHPCHAGSTSQEQVGEFGFIDWLTQKVYAKGVGFLPENKTNTIQAKTMARRAALVVAQRNLLGVINGVHIDSQTLVKNRIAADDTIVAKIKGIVQFCQVEETRMLDSRTIEVMVSMPLSGRLGKVLIDVIEETSDRSSGRSYQEVELRLMELENRVRTLEERISNLKKVSVQREDLIQLFQRLSAAWQDYIAQSGVVSQAGYASDAETAAIRESLNDQERRLASMSVHMEDLSRRLAVLETAIHRKGNVQPAKPSKETFPYTGLIVDARHTDFKPCLKPSIFINGEIIYPGDFLDLQQTVKGGYVRYYNEPQQAQQSDRVGSLPYVAEATGTQEGDRSLSLGSDTYPVLKAILQSPDNFLARARVVIVF
jgi:hypothetical protein